MMLHKYGEFCGPGGPHLMVTVYRRPWRNWFRKVYELRCWECGLCIPDPLRQMSDTATN